MLGGDAHIDGEVYDSAGAITAAELTWIKAGNRQHKEWDNTTLGTLRLNGARLVVEVNSARRRDRVAKEIAKRFGKTARLEVQGSEPAVTAIRKPSRLRQVSPCSPVLTHALRYRSPLRR